MRYAEKIKLLLLGKIGEDWRDLQNSGDKSKWLKEGKTPWGVIRTTYI